MTEVNISNEKLNNPSIIENKEKILGMIRTAFIAGSCFNGDNFHEIADEFAISMWNKIYEKS